MQKIVPHLWFDKEAREAAEFYVSVFPDSRIKHLSTIHDTPSGDAETVSFNLWGHDFMAISAGPYFKITPAISFFVACETKEQVTEFWEKLSPGGQPLMPLGSYPFSEWYGWIQDKFGVSWQIILTKPEGEMRPPIIPSLLFVGDSYGKAKEAVDYYLSIFKNSKKGIEALYGPGQEPNKEGTLAFGDFMLENVWFSAMDGGGDHKFGFNEGVSFIVRCDSQEEVDYYWQLSADPASEQCGWLKDKFGVSWQIVPSAFEDLMTNGTDEQKKRVTEAFLKMKKFDIAALEAAAKG